MTRKDRNLIATVLLLAVFSLIGLRIWLSGSRPTVLVVKRDGVEAYHVAISRAARLTEYSGPVGKSIVEVDGDRVHMLSSDCPDKVCVNMGWIRQPGQVIVCLPNRVVISLEDDR